MMRIKQPTGKVQNRHDGLVTLTCPSCNSTGRFWEIHTPEPLQQLYRCHHCDQVIKVTWHRKDKEPVAGWCDMYDVSTNAVVTMFEETIELRECRKGHKWVYKLGRQESCPYCNKDWRKIALASLLEEELSESTSR